MSYIRFTSRLLLAPEDILFVLGLIASGINLVILMQARELSATLVVEGSYYTSEVVKSTAFYITHAAQIFFLMSAGLIAFLRKMRKSGNTHHRLAFGVYVLALIAMTIHGYSFDDFISLKIVDASGPMPLLMSLLLYVGAWRRDWNLHSWIFKCIGLLMTLVILFQLIRLPSIDRTTAESYLWGYMQVYIWVTVWFLLRPGGKSLTDQLTRWGPFFIYLIVAILLQGRSRLIWAFLIFISYYYVSMRNRRRFLSSTSNLIFAALFFGSLVVLIFVSSGFGTMFSDAAEALVDRLDEDSRSDQFVKFFQEVSPWELIFGRGSLATWVWNNRVVRKDLDNWWMTALFIGGIPLVASYFWVHAVPAWRRFKKAKNLDLVCAVIVLLWCVKLFLSEAHYFMLNTYLILLCLGACLAPPPASNGMNKEIR